MLLYLFTSKRARVLAANHSATLAAGVFWNMLMSGGRRGFNGNGSTRQCSCILTLPALGKEGLFCVRQMAREKNLKKNRIDGCEAVNFSNSERGGGENQRGGPPR